ncbi:MAG: hypothetical protein DIU68_010850 [Chloroflexota bacterium]|nr:MAG: hypothetical protein DIU68_08895 [Chloroflexota bacterium]
MGFLYEEQLQTKAQAFIETLVNAGIAVHREPAMFRDYMVKLAVANAGHINIFYSPKKNTYSLALNELKNKELAEEIRALWDRSEFKQETPPATEVPPTDSMDFAEVEYYLNKLAPYRHLPFDFIDLAKALQKILGDDAIIAHRYDFDELERSYQTLRANR